MRAAKPASNARLPTKHAAKLLRKLADKFGLPSTSTLEAMGHGGITEVEQAELTTGRGKAYPGTVPIGVVRVCQGDYGTRPLPLLAGDSPYTCERTGHIDADWRSRARFGMRRGKAKLLLLNPLSFFT